MKGFVQTVIENMAVNVYEDICKCDISNEGNGYLVTKNYISRATTALMIGLNDSNLQAKSASIVGGEISLLLSNNGMDSTTSNLLTSVISNIYTDIYKYY